jgi:uncharacterized cupin superfamily protein
MNLLTPTWDGEATLPGGATARAVRLGAHAGARRLGATLYELDPGAAASPLHFHHRNEELLFVLQGRPSLRGDAGAQRELAAGEVVAFPAGRAGTHQVVNRGAEPARVLLVSTNDLPEVAEQVEAGQVVLLTGEGARLVPVEAAQSLGPG